MNEENDEIQGIPCPNCGELIEIQVIEPYGDAAPFKESLSRAQLRAEAEKHDRLVQRHARHRVIGPAPEDHVPRPLTTRDTRTLTESDRHTLAELFWKQSMMYRELAESLHQERP